MNLSFLIARRYLFSKGNRNVINIISGIAASGVAIGSLAMIIVLSGFNGIETLVAEFYTSVDPDIRIGPASGKVLSLDSVDLKQIQSVEGVSDAAPILEETVFLQYGEQQSIVTLKGVPEAYLSNLRLEDHIIEGNHGLSFEGTPRAMLGYGIADQLDLFISEGFQGIRVFSAKRNASKALNPESKFVQKRIVPMGIVALNPEFDFKYFLVPMPFAEELLERSGEASFIDVSLHSGTKPADVKEALAALLGNRLKSKPASS